MVKIVYAEIKSNDGVFEVFYKGELISKQSSFLKATQKLMKYAKGQS